jgi:RNA polymerase sigma-70 factor (ECF subfamily)
MQILPHTHADFSPSDSIRFRARRQMSRQKNVSEIPHRHVTLSPLARLILDMELNRFKTVALPLRGKLMNIAMHVLEDWADAEDVVQDAFLKLWHIREQLDEYGSVEALAVTVVKRLAIDAVRRRHGSEEWQERDSRNLHEKTPEDIMVERDDAEQIRRLINRLPALQQTIIRMKDVEGYEIAEIADITGSAPESIRVNLSRARKKIREQFLLLNNKKL